MPVSRSPFLDDSHKTDSHRQIQASSFFDDDFAKFLRVNCGTNILMRKDRNGTAIQKGSKKHRITFRDEIPVQVLSNKK